MKQIESRYALVLTGTPLENRIDELHSIVEFVDRFRLGPLFRYKAAHEVIPEDGTRVVGYRDLGKITQTLAPILLRRTKAQVLTQLPPRMDKLLLVPMTGPQWGPHDENGETVAMLVAKWRRFKFLTEADQLRLRIALQYMRMSCDSTYLIDHVTRHQTKVDELATLLADVLEDPAAKVVIFSQWLRMNELVADMLNGRGWGHVHLHGGVPGRARKDLVQTLNHDKACRVVLSTDAGSVGLNLQSAATVINLDLPWNPAVLEQRIARVHRMGQEQPVRVVNFVSEHTIEQGMLSLLKFKRSMFEGVLDGAADSVSMGEGALNRFIKTVERATDQPGRLTTSAASAAAHPAVSGPDPGKNGVDGGNNPPAAERGRASASPLSAKPSDDPIPELHSTGTAAERFDDADQRGNSEAALSELVSRGLELLAAIARPPQPPGNSQHPSEPHRPARIVADAETGARELRLRLPDAQTLDRLAHGVVAFIDILRRR